MKTQIEKYQPHQMIWDLGKETEKNNNKNALIIVGNDGLELPLV